MKMTKIAGVDTGDTTGLVIVYSETGDVAYRASHQDLLEVFIQLDLHKVAVVVLERTPHSQIQYQMTKGFLADSGIQVLEVSPGEWKPNPLCKTPAKDTPGWTQHERDALSLIKYYNILRANAQRKDS